ncbi:MULTISPECIES: alpha/beta hydrolase family protein [Streptomyces]|uniref:alpha/beta hydrolase family protein n=1 Tax=Streptomyces TaxID=1883 RepID=UPI00163B8EC5|nr:MULTISPECIES: alpha/beta hydrolase [Streptomyces]MBC2874012.1 alpha/beta hydrolase [Streptomyces sp. TYQ1024]UBI39052.1 alpha/beta hydrolase [Streptomyces mobaraensis]UKW31630.1 alpha/beta hydrolase [Streptomyces sp. TYQ1024]
MSKNPARRSVQHPARNGRGRTSAVAAAALLGALAVSQIPVVAAAAPAATGAQAVRTARAGGAAPEVPAPTVRQAIGERTLRLVDEARTDPWKPSAGKRELMVSVWYPAARSARGSTAPYVSPALSEALYGNAKLSTVRTHAVVDAEPAAGGARPLVVLSPGFGQSRASLTSVAEELASRGYVVAGVDHTYEAAVEFPGGRIEQCAVCGSEQRDNAAVVRNRAKDLRFVLDRLTAGSPAVPGLRIDRARIGVAGHSIGGAGAVEAAGQDARVAAAADMDGDFFTEPPAGGVKKPVLLLGAARAGDLGGPMDTWSPAWKGMTGWKRWLDVGKGGHMTFTDMHWLADQVGLPEGVPPEDAAGAFGTLPSDRANALTRAYLVAFFDKQLRNAPGKLLDGPSAEFPEVAFLKQEEGGGPAK